VPAVEHDFVTTLATARGFSQPTATQVLDCQGCGASFLLTPQQLSMVCPYCGSNYVVQNTQSREIIPPTAVVPIQISENKARKALILWFKQQKFDTLPQVLPARCVYLPVWAFNFGGFIQSRYAINLMNSEVSTAEDHPVSRQNVLVTATRSLPAVHRPTLESTCLDTIQPFHTKYLSHWPAETYQIPIAEASLQARAMALEKEKEDIRAERGQSIGQLTVSSSRMFIESFKLILIPVWLTRYRFAQQDFSVMIHGQSGQVNAEKPAQGISGWLNQLLSASKD
jgi:DNA-directed RNA polymerase subunit RPC12/RpoP